MIKLAITGGIGSGKTTVLNWFKSKSIATISADKIAHNLVQKGQIGLDNIVNFFGQDVLDEADELKRDYLRDLIFNNSNAKQTLENIMHPLINQEILQQIEILKANNNLVVIEIPLLAEIGKPDYIDLVWTIECSKNIQIKRVKERSNLSELDILKIINNQANNNQRAKIADLEIDNNTKILNLYKRLELELNKLVKKYAL